MKRSVRLSVLIVIQMLGCSLLRRTPRTEIVMTTDKLDYDATVALHLTGPRAVTHDGNSKGTFSGPMKINFGIQSCRGHSACIVKDAGASNVFNVRSVD